MIQIQALSTSSFLPLEVDQSIPRPVFLSSVMPFYQSHFVS